MIDNLLYIFWLWLSHRWYKYRLTGMDETTGEVEIITFATANLNIEKLIEKMKDDGVNIT